MKDHLKLGDVPWISLKAGKFKCFNSLEGFENIEKFNIIIGRNSSGKSTLLDIVQHAIQETLPNQPNNRVAEIVFSCQLTQQLADRYGARMTIGHGNVGHMTRTHYPDCLISWTSNQQNTSFITQNFIKNNPTQLSTQIATQLFEVYTNNFGNPFRNFKFSRLSAEREIFAETLEATASEMIPILKPSGEFATKILTRYLNDAELDRSLVEVKILDAINQILRPDVTILRIVPQRKSLGEWELFLEEPKKGLIPLSQTGSGIKTVLLVLMHLFLLPDLLKRNNQNNTQLSNFFFGFEELENNLHPSLQRRLFLYLRDIADREGCRFFITTHSHVVIDLFSRDKEAQLIHVAHDGESATATRISTYVGQRSVFQDLEVRASDLLQANAVVWVEGPSDRVYFNKWVDLWSEGQLQEHVDYEVAFTGGTLLAHLNYDDPAAERVADQERIEALRINGNAIILIDSDKRDNEGTLKPRVERVVSEIEGKAGLAWVTAGKEVENYIPAGVLTPLLEGPRRAPPGQFDNIFAYIKDHGGSDYSRRKVELAEQVCESLTREMLAGHLDLADKLDQVCHRLRMWNSRLDPARGRP